MLIKFKKTLKEDLWKIIEDNKEVSERNIDDFIFFIFYMFLEKENFTMEEVYEISKNLKNEYYKVLNESKDMAVMGEPIKALKNIDKKFVEKIKPILEKVI